MINVVINGQSIESYVESLVSDTCSCYSMASDDRWQDGGVWRTRRCRECGHGIAEFYTRDDLYGKPLSVEEF